MTSTTRGRMNRRDLMCGALVAGASASVLTQGRRTLAAAPGLEAGEGVVDTTPPMKAELGGFHRPPGQERRVEGIRHKTAARAGACGSGRSRRRSCRWTSPRCRPSSPRGSPAAWRKPRRSPRPNVRICATHTHSMPGFQPLTPVGLGAAWITWRRSRRRSSRPWPSRRDLAPAELHLGTARASGANFNRTSPRWKTDEQFTAEATDAERVAGHRRPRPPVRAGGRGGAEAAGPGLVPLLGPPGLLRRHPGRARLAGDRAGPDRREPRRVAILPPGPRRRREPRRRQALDRRPGQDRRRRPRRRSRPPWRGPPREGGRPADARPHGSRSPSTTTGSRDELDRYRKDPSKCTSGEWVDAGFAKEWFEAASKWQLDAKTLSFSVSTLRLGEVGWLFHPAELFSFYGLTIRHRSPTPHTLLVGYTDGIIGYLPDPSGYKGGHLRGGRRAEDPRPCRPPDRRPDPRRPAGPMASPRRLPRRPPRGLGPRRGPAPCGRLVAGRREGRPRRPRDGQGRRLSHPLMVRLRTARGCSPLRTRPARRSACRGPPRAWVVR